MCGLVAGDIGDYGTSDTIHRINVRRRVDRALDPDRTALPELLGDDAHHYAGGIFSRLDRASNRTARAYHYLLRHILERHSRDLLRQQFWLRGR